LTEEASVQENPALSPHSSLPRSGQRPQKKEQKFISNRIKEFPDSPNILEINFRNNSITER
jgi:hypothetical protein